MADKSASKMPNMKFSNRFQSNTVGKTYIIRTGGIKPFVHPVMAQITLLSDPFCRIKCDGVIRTGIDTQLTSRAKVLIQDHNPITSFPNCPIGTGIHTFRRVTMSANIDVKNKIQLIPDHLRAVFLY